jgi:tetratricopeptide (TPR) repeat protein
MPAVFLTSAMAALKLKMPGRENEAQGGLDCLDQLLKAGATPNVSAPGGFTPLHVAAEAGSERMISALLTAGADATAKNVEGQTPAAVAASWGHRAIAETLLRSSAGDDRSVDQLFSEAAEREAAQRRQQQEEKTSTSQVPVPEEPDDEKAEYLKTEGNKAFIAGDFEVALTAYQASLRHKTDAAPIWSNAAAAALKLRKFEEALRYARVARTLDPKFVKAWYREGQAAEGLKMWEDAAAAYFEAHLLQPSGGTGELDFAEMVKSAVKEGKKEFAAKKKQEEAAGMS